MLKHLLLTARRHLQKDWPYTLINVVGLTIGLSLVFFIILYVNREFSWNKSHEHRDQVYRVLVNNGNLNWNQPLTPKEFGPDVAAELPDVQYYTRLDPVRVQIVKEDGAKLPYRVYGADQGVFSIFSFKWLQGAGVSQLLQSNDEIVICRSMADGLFGEENPVGKSLQLASKAGEVSYLVTAVYDDFPATSTFKPKAIVTFDEAVNMDGAEEWVNDPRVLFFQLYFRLKKDVKKQAMVKQLKSLEDKYFEADWQYTLDLQNLSDMYLDSGDLVNARTAQGDPKKIRIFSLVGILVLLIATFNYIILASARAASRFREIGLRKVAGASRVGISAQVYGESILTSLLAFPLCLLVVALLIPKANQILGTNIAFEPGVHPWLIPGFLGVCLLVGIISGAYLAVYLSRLKPVTILRSRSGLGNTRSWLYQILVTVQILIFIGMLTCSAIIYKQVNFAENKDQGFDRENLYLIPIDMYKFKQWDAFAAELRNLSGVENAAVSMGGPPTESMGVFQLPHLQDPDLMVMVEGISMGAEYPETMGFRLVSGRFFEPGVEYDSIRPTIVNETYLRELGVEGDPIGQVIGVREIIGVIEDFHIHSVKSQITPMSFDLNTKYCYEVVVRLAAGSEEQAIKQIENVYRRMAGPDIDFRIRSFDDALHAAYHSDRYFAKTLTGFSFLAIFTAMLGLFGLSLLMAQKRIREIGIRKVHGASVFRIILTINKTFTLNALLAFVLSIPLVIWVMQGWLQNFIYRTTIGWLEFVIAGVAALVIVWITVTYHAWRAARMNPAEAIRVE